MQRGVTVCHLESLAGGVNEAPLRKASSSYPLGRASRCGRFSAASFPPCLRTILAASATQDTLDVLAYLLQENGYPAGKKPLGPPDAPNKIQFVAAKWAAKQLARPPAKIGRSEE